jgi:hypothetical protein
MKAKLAQRKEQRAKRIGYPPYDGSRTINGVRYEADKVYDIPAQIIKKHPELFNIIKGKKNG